MSARVFIFEDVKHDLSAAEKFGQVVMLFGAGEQRRSLFDGQLIEDIKGKLCEYKFNPRIDYIAATGQLNQVILLVVAMAEQNHEFSVLLFDARDRIYQEMIVNPEVRIEGLRDAAINKAIIPNIRQSPRRGHDGLVDN